VINVPLSIFHKGARRVQPHEFDGFRLPYVPASVKEEEILVYVEIDNVWNAFLGMNSSRLGGIEEYHRTEIREQVS
jgi:hypothetical protein